MLLEFSLGNYRSFNEIQTLDLRATLLKSDDKKVDNNNIVESDGERILKTIGLYGPNGSGKSNLLRGLSIFCQLVRSSLENETAMEFAADRFKLTIEEGEHAGFFQVQLLLEGKKYRYGFTLNLDGGVKQEWLFGPAEKNETWYFKRTGVDVTSNKEWFPEGYQLPLENLRFNTLFLSFASAYNGSQSQIIRKFISSQFYFERHGERTRFRRGERRIIGTSRDGYLTNQLLKEGKGQLILEWLRSAGLDYNNIVITSETESSDEEVFMEKRILDEEGKVVGRAIFDLRFNESAGTQKFYNLIGRLYNKFLTGGVVVSDEIDNNFHPSLLQQFIRFFNDPEINKAAAQLIFTSHDTTLLQPEILRRDQIYFVEKTNKDSSNLFSLADLKGIRNNSDFARQYLAGFYGALPLLQDLKNPEDNL